MKAVGTHFSVRFFKMVLISAGILLFMLLIYDYRAEESVKTLKIRYDQIEQFRNDISHLDEMLTLSARMTAATGDRTWQKLYQDYEYKLNAAVRQAIDLFPEIYRNKTGHNDIRKVHVIEHLNTLLKQQMQSALTVENSKEYLAKVSFITVLCLLLLSWLIILRISRRAQDELMESNRQLDELNQTLEVKVLGRTNHLSRALAYLQTTHQALKDAQNQLLQSEKFSAIGQLAAGVAHEINNPIGFINSNLQTLRLYVVHYKQLLGILNKLEKALKDKDQERVAEIVQSWEKIRLETNFTFMDGDISNLLNESIEGAQKIGRIVTDLRTFASPDKGVIDAVNLEVLLESILNIVWNEIKYKAEIKREYGLVPMVVCNPQKISQVFANLLINAAQAIESKGMITVKTYTRDEYVCIDVKDTGCGISEENRGKIFDPFFTTKAPGEGVGLGLSLSYDIVRKHEGDLQFNSKLGEGTTFTVMLPKPQGEGQSGEAI